MAQSSNPFQIMQSMAVVSPCSECKAFSAEPGTGPICPRRYWMDLEKSTKESNLEPPPDYILASGTDDKETLANPVFNKLNLSVTVWVALVENNQARLINGELKTVDILSPGFDTKYIQCQQVPYVPSDTWAQQMASGVLHEWDQVLAITMPTHQTRLDLANALDRDLVKIGGYVRKVDFPLNSSLTTPSFDRLASGT